MYDFSVLQILEYDTKKKKTVENWGKQHKFEVFSSLFKVKYQNSVNHDFDVFYMFDDQKIIDKSTREQNPLLDS